MTSTIVSIYDDENKYLPNYVEVRITIGITSFVRQNAGNSADSEFWHRSPSAQCCSCTLDTGLFRLICDERWSG